MTVRILEWCGLRPDDLFTIRDERGTSYKFIDAEVDANGNCTCVNAIGGKVGRSLKTGNTRTHMLRSFRPERVKVPSERTLEKQRRLRRLREEEDASDAT